MFIAIVVVLMIVVILVCIAVCAYLENMGVRANPPKIKETMEGGGAIRSIKWSGIERVACNRCGRVDIFENMYLVIETMPFFSGLPSGTTMTQVFYCYDHRPEYKLQENLWGEMYARYYTYTELPSSIKERKEYEKRKRLTRRK